MKKAVAESKGLEYCLPVTETNEPNEPMHNREQFEAISEAIRGTDPGGLVALKIHQYGHAPKDMDFRVIEHRIDGRVSLRREGTNQYAIADYASDGWVVAWTSSPEYGEPILGRVDSILDLGE